MQYRCKLGKKTVEEIDTLRSNSKVCSLLFAVNLCDMFLHGLFAVNLCDMFLHDLFAVNLCDMFLHDLLALPLSVFSECKQVLMVDSRMTFSLFAAVRCSRSCRDVSIVPSVAHSSLMFHAFRSLLTVSFHLNFGVPLGRFPYIFNSTSAWMFSDYE